MKSKIFKSEFSDLKAEVMDNGWINLIQDDGDNDRYITLGKPPNARTDIILKAIKYAESLKCK